jgi:hypothetical protein
MDQDLINYSNESSLKRPSDWDDTSQQLRLSLEGLQNDIRSIAEGVRRLNEKLDDWRAEIVRDRAEWLEKIAQSYPDLYRRMRIGNAPSALARSVRNLSVSKCSVIPPGHPLVHVSVGSGHSVSFSSGECPDPGPCPYILNERIDTLRDDLCKKSAKKS